MTSKNQFKRPLSILSLFLRKGERESSKERQNTTRKFELVLSLFLLSILSPCYSLSPLSLLPSTETSFPRMEDERRAWNVPSSTGQITTMIEREKTTRFHFLLFPRFLDPRFLLLSLSLFNTLLYSSVCLSLIHSFSQPFSFLFPFNSLEW